MKALRNDRVTLVEKGAPHSLPLMESGKVSQIFCFVFVFFGSKFFLVSATTRR